MQKKLLFRDYCLVLAPFLVLYWLTCAPGILWQDSGLFQYRIWQNDIEGRLGLALAHPLYHIIGIAAKWLPWGDYARKVNLISAVSGAFAIANLFLLIRLWLKSFWPALVGALALGLSWTFWQHCCIAETYTLYGATFLAELIFLYQFTATRKINYLYWLALMNGISLANHMWAVIPLFCYFWYLVFLLASPTQREVFGNKTVKTVLFLVGLWIIGASPYLYLIIKRLIASGDLAGTLLSAAFGDGWQGSVMNSRLTPKIVIENLLFLGLSFSSPALILLLAGGYDLVRRWRASQWHFLLLAMTVLFYWFAFRYTVPDRYAFFIPFYCLAGIIIAYGCSLLWPRIAKSGWRTALVISCFLPVAVYWIAPIAAEKYNVNLGTKRTIPYRNEYTYFLRPWQTGYRGPERFAREVLDGVEDEAIIYADSTPVYTIWYAQEILGIKPDVQLYSSHVFTEGSPFMNPDDLREVMRHYPVYVPSDRSGYVPAVVRDYFALQPHGIVWQVVSKD